jgi:AraC family transcriptional regulator
VPRTDHISRAITPLPASGPATSGEKSDAADKISGIIDTPVALSGGMLRGDTRLTQRWSHGALHDYLPGMEGHVVMTFYGAAQEITRRIGASRATSRTRPGSITLIPEGHDGHWDIAGPLEVSHVYLTEQHLQHCSEALAGGKPIELLDRVGFDDPATGHILEMLSQASVAGDPATRLFVEQAVDLLCTQLIRAHSSFNTLPQSEPRHGLADWQVKRVTAYMREFMDRDIGLEEMAALVGLSRFHFCAAFRLATGMSPYHHLTAMRMARARKLLTQHDLPIIQVALAVGYQTPSAFAASFRKATQVTPSTYRREVSGASATA